MFDLCFAADHCGGRLAQQDNIACDRAAGHPDSAHLEPQRAPMAIPPQLPGQRMSFPIFLYLPARSGSFKFEMSRHTFNFVTLSFCVQLL